MYAYSRANLCWKSVVWSITHCLGSGHETIVCAVCLSVLFWCLRVTWSYLNIICCLVPIHIGHSTQQSIYIVSNSCLNVLSVISSRSSAGLFFIEQYDVFFRELTKFRSRRIEIIASIHILTPANLQSYRMYLNLYPEPSKLCKIW